MKTRVVKWWKTIISSFKPRKRASSSEQHTSTTREQQEYVSSSESRADTRLHDHHCLEVPDQSNLEKFSLEVLLKATNNFSEDLKIGSTGPVYHATLDDGRQIAVRRATSSASLARKRAFLNEVVMLSRLNHHNLVRLLGYCEQPHELLLIYEHMDNGTLYDHLHKLHSPSIMSWPNRIKLALDVARGIEYLHEYAEPCVIHCDIKPSKILLDAMWTTKVSGFGLPLVGPLDDEFPLSVHAAATLGYLDPEYYRSQQLTKKSDVYSFGMVLLELLSGFRAIHRNEDGIPRNVADFALPYIINDETHRVLDPKMPRPLPFENGKARNVVDFVLRHIINDEIHRALDPKMPPPTSFEIRAVAYVSYLAADCLALEGRDRPTMSDLVTGLERAWDACLAPGVLPVAATRSLT